jgi:hypothetical protein
VTIGTVEYTGQAAPDFNPWLRHSYDVAGSDAKPIAATGLRIKVSSADTDIDEIEVNPSNVPPPPLVITSEGGYAIQWDGNDGAFSDTNAPARAPSHRALASQGTVAFASSEFGQGVHYATNVIDGLYGNQHSWISDFARPDTNAFVGVAFGGPVEIRSLAWGRDNGDDSEGPSNPNTDRALGIYTLQITLAANPGAGTSETGDPNTGWVTLGTIDYRSESGSFHPSRRHRFELSREGNPVRATGLRIKVSDNGTAIDELEINPQESIFLSSAPDYVIAWDGNDGDHHSPLEGAGPPDNAALTGAGTTAFGSSELDFGGIHLISHLNDGLYGNSHSWISDQGVGSGTDTSLFVGLAFGRTIALSNLAWSRDNGDTNEAGCGGTCTDRALGLYTIQFTRAANPGVDTTESGDPATGWVTLGTVRYQGQDPAFRPWMRHRYDLSDAAGSPIPATGLRILVPDGGTAIDELEVNTTAAAPGLRLSASRQGAGLVVSWGGAGTLQVADQVNGPWDDLAGAASPYTTPGFSDRQKFYRLRQ